MVVFESVCRLCAWLQASPYRGSKALWRAYWLSAFQQYSFRDSMSCILIHSFSCHLTQLPCPALLSDSQLQAGELIWTSTLLPVPGVFSYSSACLWDWNFNTMAMTITFKMIIYMLDFIRIDLRHIFIILNDCVVFPVDIWNLLEFDLCAPLVCIFSHFFTMPTSTLPGPASQCQRPGLTPSLTLWYSAIATSAEVVNLIILSLHKIMNMHVVRTCWHSITFCYRNWTGESNIKNWYFYFEKKIPHFF